MRLLLVIGLLFLCSCHSTADVANQSVAPQLDETASRLAIEKERLVPFFKPMKIEDGDWLQSHPEDGQTFEEYVKSSPTLPTADRRTIYIQPMGKFTPEQLNVIKLTADYMKAF